VGGALAFVALAWSPAALAIVAAAGFVGALCLWPWLRGQRALVRVLAGALAVIAVSAVALLGVSLLLSSGSSITPYSDVGSTPAAPKAESPMQSRGKIALVAEGRASLDEQKAPSPSDYQGLPARILIPEGTQAIRFQGQMLGASASRRVVFLALSSALVDGALMLMAVVAFGLLWLGRRGLGEGLARRWSALRAAPRSAAAEEGPQSAAEF
jgi:hypothetical protein